jgi:hypothetical protein
VPVLAAVPAGAQVLPDHIFRGGPLALGRRRQPAGGPFLIQPAVNLAPEQDPGVLGDVVGRLVDLVHGLHLHGRQSGVCGGREPHGQLDGFEPDLVVLRAEEGVQVGIGLVGDLFESGLPGGLVVKLPLERVLAGPPLTGAGPAVHFPGDGRPGVPGGPHLGSLGEERIELAAHDETSPRKAGRTEMGGDYRRGRKRWPSNRATRRQAAGTVSRRAAYRTV